MRQLRLNPNSSSASTSLFGLAFDRGIDLVRFTAGRKCDLTGRTFGKLKVIEQAESPVPRMRAWRCKCACGREVVYTTGRLLGQRKQRGIEVPNHCGCDQYSYGDKHFNWTGCGSVSGRYWSQLKRNAEKRGIAFTLTLEQANEHYERQNGLCAFSGVPIKGRDASLDRVNSANGYCKDNVQWLHKTVNVMKWSMDSGQFLVWVSRIYEHNRATSTESSCGKQDVARRG